MRDADSWIKTQQRLKEEEFEPTPEYISIRDSLIKFFKEPDKEEDGLLVWENAGNYRNMKVKIILRRKTIIFRIGDGSIFNDIDVEISQKDFKGIGYGANRLAIIDFGEKSSIQFNI